MDATMHQRYGTSSGFDRGREEMGRKHLLYYLLREGLVGHARAILEDQTSYGEEDDVEFLFWKGKCFRVLGF